MKRIIISMSVLFLFACVKTKQMQMDVFVVGNGVFIPVIVGDTTLLMQWDMGMPYSTMTAQDAKILGVEMSDEATQYVSMFTVNVVDSSLRKSTMDNAKIKAHLSKPLDVKMGELNLECEFRVLDSTVRLPYSGVIGRDLLGEFYCTINLVARTMKLSNKPLYFDSANVIDSMEFALDGNKSDINLCPVKIESDTLNLRFAASRPGAMDVGGDNSMFVDFVLRAKDTSDVVSSIFNAIFKRKHTNIEFYYQGKVTRIVYDENVNINSRNFTSYIPYYIDSTSSEKFDGYLTFAFMSRYSVLHYNPYKNMVTLYMLKGARNLRNDVYITDLLEASGAIKNNYK